MASASAFAITAVVIQHKSLASSSSPCLRPPMSLSARKSASHRLGGVQASANMREKVVLMATAAAMAAALAVPEVADAAGPGVSPSLKNFLLSIVAGGVVLIVLVGAVIAVANFDPVKRN